MSTQSSRSAGPTLTEEERETFETLHENVDDPKVQELCEIVLQSSADNEEANL